MSRRSVKLAVGFVVALAAVAMTTETAEAGHRYRGRGCNRGYSYGYAYGYSDGYYPGHFRRPVRRFRRGCFRRPYRYGRPGFGISINLGRGYYGHHGRGYYRRGGCRY